jgi:outer membrane protein TolC
MLCDRNAFLIACLMLTQAGCQSTRPNWLGQNSSAANKPERAVAYQPTKSDILQRAKSGWDQQYASAAVSPQPKPSLPTATALKPDIRPNISPVQTVNHEPPAVASEDATLTIDGKTYHVKLAPVESNPSNIQTAAGEKPELLPLPAAADDAADPLMVELVDVAMEEAQHYPLDLPTALAMVGGQHPVIGVAQWRVQEAYAQLDRAEVLWLPSLQAGFSYHRHDGNYQGSDGKIIDVNRNSFQYGLGAGGTGAGTTPRPGVVARFHMADAIFQPDIAQKNAWARGHAASAAYNKQLLDAAQAYISLLSAEQDRRILEESRDRTSDLAKLTGDFAATGQGLQADADRLATELVLVKNRLAEVDEQADTAAARLAQALSIDPGQRIVPLDPMVVPIELVSLEYNKGTLISTGLSHRPELKEAQNLVSAACDEYKRQKYAPLIPSVLLGLSTSEFGGGLGSSANDFGNRYDVDALMMWEVRNLGFGEKAARRETMARVEQAKFEKVRLLDQVAAEIAEAHAQVVHRRHRIDITQEAIESAQNSYQRNLSRIRDGQGLPLEVLQSLRALEEAHRAYLKAVVQYNQAQFQLQWALGWQVVAPANVGS